MMLRSVFSRSVSSVVPPPFLYGHRHPLIAGLIRFDDEISDESRRILQTAVFSQNHFFSKISSAAVRLVEIVSDDTVSKSDNRTLIESGVGVMIKTTLNFPGIQNVPCGVSVGFHGVGLFNDSKLYHANQVRTFANEFLTDSITAQQSVGIVLTCHEISPDDNIIDLLPGHEIIGELVEIPAKTSATNFHSSAYTVEELTEEEFSQVYEPCVQFKTQIDDVKFVGLKTHDGLLLCGGSVTSNKILVDPFVTMDCPEGDEKSIIDNFSKKFLGVKKIVFSSSDKFMLNLLGHGNVRYVVSAKPVGEFQEDIFSLLKKRPWVLGGLLV